jgi:hypothetical protein
LRNEELSDWLEKGGRLLVTSFSLLEYQGMGGEQWLFFCQKSFGGYVMGIFRRFTISYFPMLYPVQDLWLSAKLLG